MALDYSDPLLRLGERLKRRRKELGITAKDVATSAQITPAYLWMLEAGVNTKTGRPSRPSVDILARLASKLQLPREEIFALAGYETLLPSPAISDTLLPEAPQVSRERSRFPRERATSVISASSAAQFTLPHPPLDDGVLPHPERLVGRDGDLEWLLGRLRGGVAPGMTAIAGLGGIGKTALAAMAIHRLREEGRFPDGVVVILCQGITDPTSILQRVLGRLHPQRVQPETADPAHLSEIAQHLLRDKQSLVVLDNIEPGLVIEGVVTPLRAAGAAILLVARHLLPRTVVPVDATRMLGLLSPDDALDLFAQSMGRGAASELAPHEREAAAQIVTGLGRHTLAVRLAGAYAADLKRDLTVLAREIQHDPLDLPAGETPRAVERTFEQSVSSLPADASLLFSTLTAFASTEFGRPAALALAGGLGLGDPEASLNVLVLRALLHASQNAAMPEDTERERLRLHPLLRALAAGRFVALSDDVRNAANLALARHYGAYVHNTSYTGHATDEDNIVGAFEWAHDHHHDDLVVTLCAGMQAFWHDRGRTAASLHYVPWGVEAGKRLRERSPDAHADDLFWLLLSDGHSMQMAGKLDIAEQRYKRCLALAREVGDRAHEGIALRRLGDIARDRGQLDAAETHFLRSLTTTHETQSRRAEGIVLRQLGCIARDRGQLESAESYLLRSAAIAREVRNARDEGIVLAQLGRVAHRRGRLEDAESYIQQSLAIHHAICDRQSEGEDLSELGLLAQSRGSLDEAQRYYEQALAIRREVHDRRNEGRDLSRLGTLARIQGRQHDAEGYIRQALEIDREVQNRRGEGRDLFNLATIAEARGDLDEAETLYREGLAIAREVRSDPDIADVLLELGRFLVARRDEHDASCQMLGEAIDLYARMNLPRERLARETATRLGCPGHLADG